MRQIYATFIFFLGILIFQGCSVTPPSPLVPQKCNNPITPEPDLIIEPCPQTVSPLTDVMCEVKRLAYNYAKMSKAFSDAKDDAQKCR